MPKAVVLFAFTRRDDRYVPVGQNTEVFPTLENLRIPAFGFAEKAGRNRLIFSKTFPDITKPQATAVSKAIRAELSKTPLIASNERTIRKIMDAAKIARPRLNAEPGAAPVVVPVPVQEEDEMSQDQVMDMSQEQVAAVEQEIQQQGEAEVVVQDDADVDALMAQFAGMGRGGRRRRPTRKSRKTRHRRTRRRFTRA
jgi:hypothetical protein